MTTTPPIASSNKPIISVEPKDSLPVIEVWGYNITIPTSSLNTVLLGLLLIIKVQEVIKSGTKGIKLAMTALDRMDIKIIDAMDDLAVEIRETTNADRVIFFLLHNGISNPVYHWKRLSAMSESTRIGIKPIIKEIRDVLVPSIATEVKACRGFVHMNMDNPAISRKHKNFMLDTGMYGHYVRVLTDEDTKKPYGAVLIQYSTPEQCNRDWSQHTHDSLENKLDILYNLFSKRTGSERFKFISKVKEFMSFGK